ncbi:hypothetical protein PENTCL1PPCAC_16705, partial [Pristionchus entomophagus]
INILTIIVILLKTPNTLKDYSYLLLHDCFIESLSILSHFLVNARLFISSTTVLNVSNGPCHRPLGLCRLQFTCILLFIPHIFHIAGFVCTLSSRYDLEHVIDKFYHDGYAKEYGLYGYTDISEPVPAIFMGYMICFPLSVNAYVGISRNRLLSILQKKEDHMSRRTRNTHESLAKALTIHAVFPMFVTTGET